MKRMMMMYQSGDDLAFFDEYRRNLFARVVCYRLACFGQHSSVRKKVLIRFGLGGLLALVERLLVVQYSGSIVKTNGFQ